MSHWGRFGLGHFVPVGTHLKILLSLLLGNLKAPIGFLSMPIGVYNTYGSTLFFTSLPAYRAIYAAFLAEALEVVFQRCFSRLAFSR